MVVGYLSAGHPVAHVTLATATRHHGREPALEEDTRAPSIELGQTAQVAALLGDALLEEHPGDADAGRVVVAR
eukprot:6775926-Alexandrium_andersonii.AAC.1